MRYSVYSVLELRDRIHRIHDIDVNQKYGKDQPYSFHLKAVEAQGEKFKDLWWRLWHNHFHVHKEGDVIPTRELEVVHRNGRLEIDLEEKIDETMKITLTGHDLIEDARMTWNDVVALISHSPLHRNATLIADIIYDVTDEKGKSRKERKNDQYYTALQSNCFAVFVKLADIAANTLFSKLTGSSMYEKYKSEFATVKEKIYREELKEMFNYVENL